MSQIRRTFRPSKGRKALHTPVSQDIPSATYGDLPVEVLEQVLDVLSSSLEETALRYRSDFSYDDHAADHHTRLALRALSSAVITCRAWYRIGISILYSRVFILSDYHLSCFARTVSKARDLAALTKDVTILQDLLVDPTRPDSSSRNLRLGFQKLSLSLPPIRRFLRKPPEDFILILHSCPLLESLSIRKFCVKQQSSSLFPLNTAFAGIASRKLRKLTLFPTTEPRLSRLSPDYWLSQEISLYALEVLCLRSITIPDNFVLPYLPRLHTLQMIQTIPRFPHGRGDITLSPHETPSLHTLDFYQNTSEIIVEPELLNSIRHLSIVGRRELQLSSTWVQVEVPAQAPHLPAPPHLRSLTYGTTWFPIPDSDFTLSYYDVKHLSWHSLQSLYVVVWAKAEYGEAWSTSHRVLQGLIRRLQSPEDSPCLRKVAILKEDSCGALRIPLTDEVRGVCVARGLSYFESDSE